MSQLCLNVYSVYLQMYDVLSCISVPHVNVVMFGVCLIVSQVKSDIFPTALLMFIDTIYIMIQTKS